MAKLTDREFMERAVVVGHISEAQGEECLDIVRRARDKGSPIRIAEVLVQRRYMTESQTRSVRYGGKVITLHCPSCGNECRMRGRRSTNARQCPKCGDALVEGGDKAPDADEPAPAGPPAPAAAPQAQDPEANAAAIDVAAEEDRPTGPPARTAEPTPRPQPMAPIAEWCLGVVWSRWFVTLVLTAVGTMLLRGLFALSGAA